MIGDSPRRPSSAFGAPPSRMATPTRGGYSNLIRPPHAPPQPATPGAPPAQQPSLPQGWPGVPNPVSPPPPMSSVYNAPPPPMISDFAAQKAANAQYASGYGVRESALADSNRSGVSRGRGQQHWADMAQEAADAKGGALASQVLSDVNASNAKAMYEHAATMRNEGLAQQGLVEGLRSARENARIQQQSAMLDLYQAQRMGQLELMQMQAQMRMQQMAPRYQYQAQQAAQQFDWTPLLAGLFD